MLEFMYYLSQYKQQDLPKTLSLSLGSMSWFVFSLALILIIFFSSLFYYYCYFFFFQVLL